MGYSHDKSMRGIISIKFLTADNWPTSFPNGSISRRIGLLCLTSMAE